MLILWMRGAFFASNDPSYTDLLFYCQPFCESSATTGQKYIAPNPLKPLKTVFMFVA